MTWETVDHEFGANITVMRRQSSDPPSPNEIEDAIAVVFFYREYKVFDTGCAPVKNQADLARWCDAPRRHDYNDDLNGKDAWEYEYSAWEDAFEREEWAAFAVDAHIHSGIRLYVGGELDAHEEAPDAAVFVRKSDFPDGDYEALAEAFIEEWNKYFLGDVYDYCLKLTRGDGEVFEGEPLWDAYDEKEAMQELQSEAKWLIEKYEKPFEQIYAILRPDGTWEKRVQSYAFGETPQAPVVADCITVELP